MALVRTLARLGLDFLWHYSAVVTGAHCTALHCTALHCTALHCTARQSRHTGFYSFTVYCTVRSVQTAAKLLKAVAERGSWSAAIHDAYATAHCTVPTTIG